MSATQSNIAARPPLTSSAATQDFRAVEQDAREGACLSRADWIQNDEARHWYTSLLTGIEAAMSAASTATGKDFYAIVGPTTVGKSTLVNFLAGVPMTETKDEDGDTVVGVSDGYTPIAPIGDGEKSQTLVPTIHNIGTGRDSIAIADFPGSSDDRGSVFAAALTQLALRLTLEEANTILGVVALIPASSFKNFTEANGLKQLVTSLRGLLRSDSLPSSDSVRVLISKSNGMSQERIREKADRYLEFLEGADTQSAVGCRYDAEKLLKRTPMAANPLSDDPSHPDQLLDYIQECEPLDPAELTRIRDINASATYPQELINTIGTVFESVGLEIANALKYHFSAFDGRHTSQNNMDFMEVIKGLVSDLHLIATTFGSKPILDKYQTAVSAKIEGVIADKKEKVMNLSTDFYKSFEEKKPVDDIIAELEKNSAWADMILDAGLTQFDIDGVEQCHLMNYRFAQAKNSINERQKEINDLSARFIGFVTSKQWDMAVSTLTELKIAGAPSEYLAELQTSIEKSQKIALNKEISKKIATINTLLAAETVQGRADADLLIKDLVEVLGADDQRLVSIRNSLERSKRLDKYEVCSATMERLAQMPTNKWAETIRRLDEQAHSLNRPTSSADEIEKQKVLRTKIEDTKTIVRGQAVKLYMGELKETLQAEKRNKMGFITGPDLMSSTDATETPVSIILKLQKAAGLTGSVAIVSNSSSTISATDMVYAGDKSDCVFSVSTDDRSYTVHIGIESGRFLKQNGAMTNGWRSLKTGGDGLTLAKHKEAEAIKIGYGSTPGSPHTIHEAVSFNILAVTFKTSK